MQILFLIFMFILGAALGSFLCCQARRGEVRCSFEGHPQSLRGRSEEPRKDGRDERPEKEHELPPRSICLHCKKKLKWYDNIPIISWCALKGKCRFCHKKIGLVEIISELSGAIALTMLGTTISVETAGPGVWLQFILVTIFTFFLLFLAIYDGISGKLPVLALTLSAICAIMIVILPRGYSFLVVDFLDWSKFCESLVLPMLSGLLFGGIYLILYLVSKGKWVGDGDWILAAAIGLTLGHPWLSMIALFIANFSACLVMYPIVKNKKSRQIYFGPFLVLAFVITYTFRDIMLICIS